MAAGADDVAGEADGAVVGDGLTETGTKAGVDELIIVDVETGAVALPGVVELPGADVGIG